MSTEKMIQIELGGPLGKIYGRKHFRLISKISEAGVALAKTIPGFESYMLSSKRRGLTFAIFKGKKNIGIDDFGFPVTGDVIKIVPVVIGSKKAGLLQTILGAVIIAASAIGSYFAPGNPISAFGFKFGAAVMLGGIVQMLSPQPAGLASKQDADNQASYAFGGVTNTAAQGNPVPLGYGRRLVGGAIVSAGIYVEDKQ